MAWPTALFLGILSPEVHKYAEPLCEAANRFTVDTNKRVACWLGQMHVESAGFTRTRENMNYRVETLLKTFGRHRITTAEANKLGAIPGKQRADKEGIANRLYGGDWGRKNLGNTQEGDGWRFIGRGFKQVTGRYNYGVISNHLYGDDRLLEHPEILELPTPASLSAGDFWASHDLNKLADGMNHAAITKTINGGNIALRERGDMSAIYLRRIDRFYETYVPVVETKKSRPDFSNVVGGVRSTERFRDGE